MSGTRKRRPAGRLFLFEQAFLGAAFFIIAFVLVAAQVGQALLQLGGELGEIDEQLVAEFFVKLGAQIFITGSETQRLDGS